MDTLNTTNNKSSLPFVKMQGCGNDFILVESSLILMDRDLSSLAKKMCDRNYGVGGDGLIIVHPSEKSDFRMQIINSDGSEPEMCGNGIRCFARYLDMSKKTDRKDLEIETLAGIIKPSIVEINNNIQVKVDMGEPILKPLEVPVSGFDNLDKVVNQDLEIEGKVFKINAVSMGNPHCIIFVDDLDKVEFEHWGPIIEKFKTFPKKTNVEFVKIEDRNNLRVKVWERGAGATLACGTGACATLVAGVLNNICEKTANVHLPGGTLQIEWRDDNRVIMTGPAEMSFAGVYHII
ncbi:MAG: diaminopimelate epimerase [Candidatus Sericytochromatia bacterium]